MCVEFWVAPTGGIRVRGVWLPSLVGSGGSAATVMTPGSWDKS